MIIQNLYSHLNLKALKIAIPFFVCIFLLFSSKLEAQTVLKGKVLNKENQGIADVDIRINENKNLCKTDADGNFELDLDGNETIVYFGYLNDRKIFGKLVTIQKGSRIQFDTAYKDSGLSLLPVIYIRLSEQTNPFTTILNPREFQTMVGIGNGVEQLIKLQMGVSSNNELSSNYSVRGGNFDENLVYINDIEIYRPQLIQSGQQEGLSILNSDLVSNVNFSAGGFDAKYGDKMSSVLDIAYLKPDSFIAIANAGRLYNSFSVGGKSKNKKFTSLVGLRYFTNSLLANSLDEQGSYRMNFGDAQLYLSHKLRKRMNLEFLGNLSANRYSLFPQSRTSSFGTVSEAFQLDVNMGGQENMQYDYGLAALTLQFRMDSRHEFKWIASVTGISEREVFDVGGAYALRLLDRDIGSKTYGKPLRTLGFGYYLDRGRNNLQTRVLNLQHLGTIKRQKSKLILRYGVKIQQEKIFDRLHEWRYNDSADYNVPPFGFATDSIVFSDMLFGKQLLQSMRYQSFFQTSYLFNSEKNMLLNFGVRAHFWDLNNELFVSPRINFSWEPNKKYNLNKVDSLQRNPVVLKIAVGAYFQSPFYRELRGENGQLNLALQSQKSYHLILGRDVYFTWLKRKLRYTAEIYGKYMTDLVPYYYDNIRIRYIAKNSSYGYTWGIDNRINGKFVRGLETWATLSLMQTKERIEYTNSLGNDTLSDWLRRPTDRRVNFSLVFQDKLPKNPDYRVSLSMLVSSGMPYFLNGDFRYTRTYKIPSYRRIDIGFIKVLHLEKYKRFSNFSNCWVSLDVFNLLDISNVISYSWVKDLRNNIYGVPEYLTRRRINLRLHLEF